MRKIIAALVLVATGLFVPAVVAAPPASAAVGSSCYAPSGAVGVINDHQSTDPVPWGRLNVISYVGCAGICIGNCYTVAWDKPDGRVLYVFYQSSRNELVKYACVTTQGGSCFVPV